MARPPGEYFLANAERGDNVANDELITELLRRMRAGSFSVSGSP
jgi:hypothetical protein